MVGLLALPLELKLEIFGYLDHRARGNFRLSSPVINSVVQEEIDRRFAERDHRVTLEHKRLETLVDIAQDPKMSLLVRRISIANHVWTASTFITSSFHGYLDLLLLKHSGQARHLLAMAFSHFRNLESIRITRRFIDPRTLPEWNDTFSGMPFGETDLDSPLVMLVLLALGDTDIRPTAIRIEDEDTYTPGEQPKRMPIPLYSFAIPPRSGLPCMLNSLRLLSLGLTVEDEVSVNNLKDLRNDGLVLLEFIRHLTSLTTLRLSFSEDQMLASDLLPWICDVSKKGPGAGLRKLQVLELSYISVPPRVLTTICRKSGLEEVSLISPTLLYDPYHKDGFTYNRESHKIDHWSTFLKRLSKDVFIEVHTLKRFKISHPAQWREEALGSIGTTSFRYRPTDVFFKPGKWSKTTDREIEYESIGSSQSLHQCLAEVADHTYIGVDALG